MVRDDLAGAGSLPSINLPPDEQNYHLQLTLVNGNTVSMLDWLSSKK